ncbi:MAG: M1 family aminopeptidase, partial [Gammaproteobacteria bacterium]|nr:M1 family aminopeptidase [Gammaproteobacteria bacterium]
VQVKDSLLVTERDHYRFRLASWLVIESLAIDGVPASALRQDYGYVVRLPDAGRHRLDFVLRGVVPPRDAAQQASAGMFSSSGSDGAYLPGYDAWIPHDGSEPIAYRLQVEVPAAQRAVASGRLVSEQSGDQFYQAVFEATQPGEAPSLFAGPYQVRERRSNGLRLRTYFHAELEGLSDIYLDAAAAYIQRYDRAVGAYPYADFHIISAPLPVGLGFPNLTYVGRAVIPLPFMRGRSLAHEVLHNWWGNGVAVDYAHGNWAEGLTTFMADYALERDQGPDAARSMRLKWLRDYAALPAGRDQPVRAFKSKQHQASQVIGYNKVAFIFHMLTLEIGQSAFDAGLRDFWAQNKYKAAGWRELRQAFERSAGRDLDWFFVQWLDRRGAPRLSLGAHRVEQLEDGFRLSVEILQPVSGYRFKLPVSLQTANGIERHEISVSETLTRVEWTTSAKPRALHFDPDSDVFRLLQPGEAPPILRDITLGAKVATVIGSDDAEFVSVARGLAGRLMDVAPRFEQLPLAGAIDRPLMLITTTGNLTEQLVQLGLQRPPELTGSAWSAAAWTARLANGNPALIVSADDAAALQTLLRPLPHYGGQSYVLFAAGRAVGKGIWPVSRGPLFLDLSGG